MSSSHMVSVTIGRAVEVGLGGVLTEALDREAAQAGVHALVQQALHLLALLRRGRAGLGRLEAHHVGHQRRGRHVLDDVHAQRRALEGVEVLRDRLPVPDHALLHRLVGDGLGAGHGQHRALTELGLDRREAEAAVAQHQRRHAVPARGRAVGVPADLGVVVGVQVDEAGRHDQAVGVDGAVGRALGPAADLGDAAVLDPQVAPEPGHPRAVDDRAALDVDVVAGHGSPFGLADPRGTLLREPGGPSLPWAGPPPRSNQAVKPPRRPSGSALVGVLGVAGPLATPAGAPCRSGSGRLRRPGSARRRGDHQLRSACPRCDSRNARGPALASGSRRGAGAGTCPSPVRRRRRGPRLGQQGNALPAAPRRTPERSRTSGGPGSRRGHREVVPAAHRAARPSRRSPDRRRSGRAAGSRRRSRPLP